MPDEMPYRRAADDAGSTTPRPLPPPTTRCPLTSPPARIAPPTEKKAMSTGRTEQPPAAAVAAPHDRLPLQPRPVPDRHADVERVHVDVQDRAAHRVDRRHLPTPCARGRTGSAEARQQVQRGCERHEVGGRADGRL